MERPPKFLKDFSRKEHQSARDQVAADIRASRRQRDATMRQPIKEPTLIEQSTKRLHALETILEDIEETSEGVGPDPSELTALKRAYTDRLTSFYDEMERRWEDAHFSKEEIENLFSEQHLATLSLKEYVLLLKRFPSHLQTHVVRQGIRDHIGSEFHNTRSGEYHNSFREILLDRRLYSFLNLWLANGAKREVVSRFLQLDTARSREDALYKLKSFLNPVMDITASLPDQSAVHLALDAVVDKFYGAETGNEIFFAFPALHIVSQHLYSNFSNFDNLGDKRVIQNDVWALSKGANGLSIEASVVFIPASARVDPDTGSRYELNERLEPFLEEDRIQEVGVLMERFAMEDIYDMVQELQDQRRALSDEAFESERGLLKRRIQERFDVRDERLLEALITPYFASLLAFQDRTLSRRERIMKALFRARSLYKEAAQTISSEEYWERHFARHPEQRPSKLCYYPESDATEALEAFKRRSGLVKKADKKPYEIGFPENRLDFYRLPAKNPHYADQDGRFEKTAMDIIDERFPE